MRDRRDRRAEACLELVEAMNSLLAHRGPDGTGAWQSPCGRVVLGHQRLAILDLSERGRQPLASEDRSVTIAYNGEVYNYWEVRQGLQQRGHRFRTETDTEVLVSLYGEKGEDLLEDLNGMFAFALFDARWGRLFAARDRAGVKPLYYAQLPSGTLVISSELKALLAVPGVDRTLDLEAIADYLAYQFIPDPQTPFRGVRRLPPAHSLTWQDRRAEVRRWWRAAPPLRGDCAPIGLDEAFQKVRAALARAVERQLVIDRPVGASLSGGLDSSAIVAAMVRARHGGEVGCYTVGYTAEDQRIDPFEEDLPHVQRVAEYLGGALKALQVRAAAASLWPRLVQCSTSR